MDREILNPVTRQLSAHGSWWTNLEIAGGVTPGNSSSSKSRFTQAGDAGMLKRDDDFVTSERGQASVGAAEQLIVEGFSTLQWRLVEPVGTGRVPAG